MASRSKQDETAPLLPRDGASSSSSLSSPSGDGLPRFQLFLLCYARLIEPIAFFSIFSFITKMVQDIGHIPTEDVGPYTGLVESLFSLAQMCVMVFWARASDRIGRKPVLAISMLAVSLASGLFGFASSIWEMVVFRCVAGVFAGSVVTIRTMTAEISTKETQGIAFSWFAVSGNLGIFVGPFIGGLLADPVNQYPNFFPKIRLFIDYPYALPGLATCVLGLGSCLMLVLFLRETLPSSVRKVSAGPDSEESSPSSPASPSSSPASPSSSPTSPTSPASPSSPTPPQASTSSPPLNMSTLQLARYPGIPPLLISCSIMVFLAFAYTAIMPVFLFTPVALGGFSFGSFGTSVFIGLQGLSQSLWLFFAFPPLQKKYGARRCMVVLSKIFPYVFIPIPLLNLLLRIADATPATPNAPFPTPSPTAPSFAMPLFWALFSIELTIMPGIAIGFVASQLCINAAAPSPKYLATINALYLVIASGLRSVAPMLTTAVYAWSIKSGLLGGHLFWGVVMMFGWLFRWSTAYLPDDGHEAPVE